LKAPLIAAAVVEMATGLVLVVAPAFVGRLLLSSELTGVAIPVAHVLGIAFIALGVACWPGTPLCGMLIYNSAATLYLAYLGVMGRFVGPLLWPAVLGHLVLTAFLARLSINKRNA
jgi:hypothetical protein